MSGLQRGGSNSSDRERLARSGPKGAWRDSMWKNYGIAAVGEFLGTFLFLFFGMAAAQCVKLAYDPLKEAQHDPSQAYPTAAFLLYISFAFGISLAVNVWIFYRISGGIFNPAVTLGVVVLGGMPLVKGAILTVSQLLGGIVAAGLVEGLLPGPLSVNTELGGGISVVQGLFLEMFLTFELVLTIYFLAVEKHRATFMAPLGIGLALFIAHLVGILFTGASLNPARSLGPALVTGSFPSHHWIYWVGPGLGSLLATGFYKVLTVVDYRTANPGQDDDGSAPPATYTISGTLDGRDSGKPSASSTNREGADIV